MNPMPQETHLSLSAERAALRERLNLRLVSGPEEGCNIEALPEGVYGFTTSPASDELPLFARPIYQCTEIHKLAGGGVCYVGYVTAAENEAFQKGAEAMALHLYPEPFGEAATLVSIPQARVDRKRTPTRDEGNAMKMEISPRPEYLGMTSTFN
jgi:hypothetical protein